MDVSAKGDGWSSGGMCCVFTCASLPQRGWGARMRSGQIGRSPRDWMLSLHSSCRGPGAAPDAPRARTETPSKRAGAEGAAGEGHSGRSGRDGLRRSAMPAAVNLALPSTCAHTRHAHGRTHVRSACRRSRPQLGQSLRRARGGGARRGCLANLVPLPELDDVVVLRRIARAARSLRVHQLLQQLVRAAAEPRIRVGGRPIGAGLRSLLHAAPSLQSSGPPLTS